MILPNNEIQAPKYKKIPNDNIQDDTALGVRCVAIGDALQHRIPGNLFETALPIPGKKPRANSQEGKGHQSQNGQFRAHVGQPGAIVHDLSDSLQEVGQGKNICKAFDPVGCSFDREPDLGQKHHRPCDEVQ
jgi:hypothetical protein